MRGRTAEHPEMEVQLFHEFKEMGQAGKPVKRWCFARRAKQILNEKNPDHSWISIFKYLVRTISESVQHFNAMQWLPKKEAFSDVL